MCSSVDFFNPTRHTMNSHPHSPTLALQTPPQTLQQKPRTKITDIGGDANQIRRMVLAAIPVCESRTGPYAPSIDPRRSQQLEDLVQALANLFLRMKAERGFAITAEAFMKHLELDALRALIANAPIEHPAFTLEIDALRAYLSGIEADSAAAGQPPEWTHGFVVLLLVRSLTSMLDGYCSCPWMRGSGPGQHHAVIDGALDAAG